MKIKLTAIALSALLLFAACSEKPPEIDNFNEYTGDGIAVTMQTECTPAVIPDGTAAITDESGTSTVTDTETATDEPEALTVETDAPVQTTKAPETVASTAKVTTTEKPVQTTVTTKVTTAATTAVPVTTTTVPPPSNTGSFTKNSYSALNYTEVKGIWISYIELYPILTGKTEAQFTENIKNVYKKCVDLGLNTVFVHVRPFGDALYKSTYYPWSKYAAGSIGSAPSFDPLKIMVEQAHAVGLSFQAWINPFRLCGTSEISKISTDYAIGKWYNDSSKKDNYIVKVNNNWYLNPAYKECLELITNGVSEIVSNYNVDGVHIDDYFYPTTDASFDSTAFATSGYSSLKSFRLNNCDNLVKGLYSAVKSINKTAVFGASTQGNVYNNLNYMYADVEKWCSHSGYVDYMAPQIYYGFKNSGHPYETCLKQWQNMVAGTSVKIIPGLAVYKIGTYDSYGKGDEGKNEWINDTEIIKRQILTSRNISNYGGFVLYSYAYVFEPTSYQTQISAEIKAVKDVI